MAEYNCINIIKQYGSLNQIKGAAIFGLICTAFRHNNLEIADYLHKNNNIDIYEPDAKAQSLGISRGSDPADMYHFIFQTAISHVNTTKAVIHIIEMKPDPKNKRHYLKNGKHHGNCPYKMIKLLNGIPVNLHDDPELGEYLSKINIDHWKITTNKLSKNIRRHMISSYSFGCI